MIEIEYQTAEGDWRVLGPTFTTPEEARKLARERCAYWRLVNADTGEVIDSRER
jgi:hypothetical protein